ncbi:hypothetical protein [Nonomuraea rubra]|uniref:hypothetical protein n=1 Tax=Nonomuraea rubra TaxID=46180 RepID=UPI0031F09EA1
MITPFDKDHAELAEIGGCITYVHGLTPKEIAIRLGGRLETSNRRPSSSCAAAVHPGRSSASQSSVTG